MKPKLSFPRYGQYTVVLSWLFRELGAEVVDPPPITKRTIELGTRYSPGDICYPFKITLGTMIEAVEGGADTIVMANTYGWCILRCYAVVQARIMKDLGYDFRMCSLSVRRPFKFYRDIKRIFPDISLPKLIKIMAEFFKKVKALDAVEEKINISSDTRVGIIGEVYVCNESTLNMDIVKKLQGMGLFVDRWLCLSTNLEMLFQDMFGISGVSRYGRIAGKYFPARIGGHANENLVKMVKYAEEGYDGVVMLKPFACNPETAIEPIVECISRDYNMPVLFLSIDEATLETHWQTRIESFADMVKMRKGAR